MFSRRAGQGTQFDDQRQGGDLRGLEGRDHLDLGTCVNRYGPPRAVAEALAGLEIGQLQAHPYDAEQIFVSAYSDFLKADPRHLVAGRGITEFIQALADLLPTDQVAVITPDYTDTIRLLRRHVGPPNGVRETPGDRLNRVDYAMGRYPYVILSNPNNPTGIYLHADQLASVCREHKNSVLIVDEAYIDFVADGCHSLIHYNLSNVIVLRSPNKPFGIAGVRTGALWSLDDRVRALVSKHKIKWSLSRLDVVVAVAALGSTTWLDETRRMLLADAAVLERALIGRFGEAVTGTPVHYRFIQLQNPEDLYRRVLDAGIVTRIFTAGTPGRVPGLRITTPTHDEMPRLLETLDSCI